MAKAKAKKQETVTRAQLAAGLATDQGITKADANRILTSLLDQIKADVQAGNKVSISGFGIFTVRHSPARMGRNPQTGDAIKIKAKTKLVFRPAKAWKDEVA